VTGDGWNDSEKSPNAREIFHRALDHKEEERAAFVDEQCGGDESLLGEVLSLLASHDAAGDFLEEPALAVSAASVLGADPPEVGGPDPIEHPGRIGVYEILEVLGEGGMGTVYLAEQTEPVSRKVAVKVIKLGMNTKEVVRRFELERQALAMMNHPGIASVFDGGSTEQGQPYFVMERVPGRMITEYCDDRRLNTFARLKLFMQVCEAIQHAHQKGIIHRDIKPSNVLVSGENGRHLPKIIDFGVARATDRRLTTETAWTAQGMIIGTPEYMSPEQAGSGAPDVDTRTDIYSLGVLLYELLVGKLPFDFRSDKHATYSDIQRRISEENPQVPSRRFSSLGAEIAAAARLRRTAPQILKRQLRGDLDWITMKAMEKDRTRRYGTAAEFAADIGRHLDNEPVLAGPPSTIYRLKKFVAKNRGPVAAVLAVVLALAIGLTTSLRLFFVSEGLKSVADRRLSDYRNLADIFRIENLRNEAALLWPAWPEKVPAVDAWLAEARELAGRLEGYKAKLLEIQQRTPESSQPFQPGGRLNEGEQHWLEGKLARLVSELEDFADPDPEIGVIADVAERRRLVSGVEDEIHVRYRPEWESAIASISDRAECPMYGGLRIKPQFGLIPIGPDPRSKMWEFAVSGSGEVPRRDADGRLSTTGRSAIVLVLLPGNSFQMGSEEAGRIKEDPGEKGFYTPGREGPVHTVTLDPFFMSKYELTHGQWRRISRRIPDLPPAGAGELEDEEQLINLEPATQMSWNDCNVILPRLGLELPTEAQWEYAARAGTRTVWYTGDSMESIEGHGNIRDRAAREQGLIMIARPHEDWLDDGYAKVAPVGSFEPNPFGIHDVIGNVYELCRDWLVIYTSPVREGDGERIPDIPDPKTRIVRSGNWDCVALATRMSFRVDTEPARNDPGVGVRPSRRPDE